MLNLRTSTTTLVLTVLGCNGCNSGNGGTANEGDSTTSGPGATDSVGTTTATDSGPAATEASPTTAGTGDLEDTGQTGDTGDTGDTGEPTTGDEPTWCAGFDPNDASPPTFSNVDDVQIVDGAQLIAKCESFGVVLPVFIKFGGFEPASSVVPYDLVVDVAGFNLGPTGHFYESVEADHEVDCTEVETGQVYDDWVYGIFPYLPVFPPMAIPDLSVLDGAPGTLQITMHTPEGDLEFAAEVILEIPDGITECP